MESTAPEAVDLAKESEATKDAYGLNDPMSKDYGTSLLRARRLVERNVRFIQVVSGPLEGAGNGEDRNWDAHQDLERNHGAHARAVDKPIAGLLADLKARGLLESTLVVWTSEFGRTSYGQSGNGRDHNPWGYTQWLAGGGVKAGSTYGQTDEIGLQSVGDKVDTYDLHATVLQQLGLDHLKTIYLRAGRAERPTVVYGHVVKELLA
jgi:membrane-anchored protein YejM (alkaline phosphatase superfamily)